MSSNFSGDREYKVRQFVNGKRSDGSPFRNYSLTIPTQIAEKLPEDIRFTCELNDDGILFKPVNGNLEKSISLPSWVVTSARR